MSEELREAIGGVIGLIFGGVILLMVSSRVDAQMPVNLSAWAFLFFIGALGLGAVVLYGIIMSVFGGGR